MPRNSRVVTWVCAVLLVALFALPFLVASQKNAPEGEKFGGSDDAATSQIEKTDPGYKPWFHSVFEPSSGEVESGLFAMQAALGAGLFGYAIGALRGRKRGREEAEAALRTGPADLPTVDTRTSAPASAAAGASMTAPQPTDRVAGGTTGGATPGERARP